MATGISLHIGINSVDPDHYGGWDGALAACEADAKDMAALAKAQGFATSTLLLTSQGTTSAVRAAILSAAKSLVSGDTFLLTYAGHGGQMPDTNKDEPDGKDETWVLYDRQLIDDELAQLYGKFKKGVRIIVLSDSCHSGTVTRAVPPWLEGGPKARWMPSSIGNRVFKAHQKEYAAIQAENRAGEKSKLNATVLLLSGCQDNQLSQDGPRNGLFTGTLKKVWNGGKFKGNYRKFRDSIVAKMPATQTPNYFVIGASNPAFEAQKPFTI